MSLLLKVKLTSNFKLFESSTTNETTDLAVWNGSNTDKPSHGSVEYTEYPRLAVNGGKI